MSKELNINFVRLQKDAIVPEYEKDGDAACSLRVVEDYLIKPGQRVLAKTGLAVAIPYGFEGQVRPRSGNAFKKGLTVLNSPGTVDSGYRGEIMIILHNSGDKSILIKKGDAAAQLKFAPVYKGVFVEVDELDETERNTGGIGHTGR